MEQYSVVFNGLGCLKTNCHLTLKAYTLSTLTTNQCNNAHIEKELLGIVFVCVKFHQYIYDHKPLDNTIVQSSSKITEVNVENTTAFVITVPFTKMANQCTCSRDCLEHA